MIEPGTFDWSPGHVTLKNDGAQPTLCLMYDGAGVYCGMLRVGKSTLQFTRQPPTIAKSKRVWQDAAVRWAAFPSWARRAATEALHLHTVF